MNKKAFIAIIIALIVPAVIFLYVNSLPKAAIPRAVFYDSVSTRVVNGKEVTDTFWHHIPNFTLTNQLGHKVSYSDIALNDSGKITVVDFFFTHCTSICPGMTMEMRRLQNTVKMGKRVGDNSADYVQFISFSIDPGRDSVAALKKWADRFQVDPDNWWLLTGDEKTIYDLSLKHMMLSVQNPEIDTIWPHTDIFILLDKHGVVRTRRDKDGNPMFYHSRDEQSMSNLAQDIVWLSLEKDESTKSPLAGKLPLIGIVMGIVVIAMGLLFYTLSKKKSNAATGLEKK